MTKTKHITPGHCFRDMLNTNREVGNKYGENGEWKAIEWLAYHVGEIDYKLGVLEKKVKKMGKRK